MNFFILDLLALPPDVPGLIAEIAGRAARLSCVDNRFQAFAVEAGVECGPLPVTERHRLRAEVDALVANAYGLTAEDLEVIFTDFTSDAVPQSYRDLVRQAFRELT